MSGEVIQPQQRVSARSRAGVRVAHPAHWFAVAAGTLLVLALGTTGFVRLLDDTGRPWDWLEPVVLSIGLFFGRFPGDLGHDVPLELQAARLLGPVVLAYGVITAFLRDSLWRLRHARLAVLSGHTLILGLDARAVSLARDLRARGVDVVVVDELAAPAHVDESRRGGALLVAGYPGDPAVLRAARAPRARNLIVFAENDAAGLDIALSALQAMGGSGPRVRVGLSDRSLTSRLTLRAGVLGDAALDRLSLVAGPALEARALMERFPLDGPGIAPTDATRAVLVLVGDSPLIDALAAQAARVGHFTNGTSVTVILADAAAGAIRARLTDADPCLPQAAPLHEAPGDPISPASWERVYALLPPGPVRLTAVFASPGGELNLSRALAMPAAPAGVAGVAVVSIPEARTLASTLRRSGEPIAGALSLEPISPQDEAYTGANIFDEALDTMARAVHEHYLRGQRADGKLNPALPAHRAWEQLPAEYREASRYQAAHIGIKLRALGLRVGPAGPGSVQAPFTHEQMEALSKAEHQRWAADRLLAGWTLGPVKDPAHRQTPFLCPWDDLPEEVREWDRRAVRSIPDTLALVGLGAFPAGAPTPAGRS